MRRRERVGAECRVVADVAKTFDCWYRSGSLIPSIAPKESATASLVCADATGRPSFALH
ncbi:hypothetical protein Poly59_21650 [Rubripirellula reticaptiva]|uniref:Uncharacterized protein n=1 Tax=Rubripirellula reticaptiva TaxID=2528013 RepID=A0A5C6F429_9BACT|nr:hypothetical protein Poly59_21650 [Rubripirellula reticaptiva]